MAAVATFIGHALGLPRQSWWLTPKQFEAEIEAVKAGQRKATPRAPVPKNSNAAMLRALRAAHPALYDGELTPPILRKLNSWIGRHYPKNRKVLDETLARAIRRERVARARRK